MSDAPQGQRMYAVYAREDRAQVEPIVSTLRHLHVTLSIDAERAPGQGNYVVESQQALRDADTLLVFVSAAAVKSPWVESEVRAFQTQMAHGRHRQVIAVRLDETPLPVALAHTEPIDGAGMAADALAALILTRSRQTHTAPQEPGAAVDAVSSGPAPFAPPPPPPPPPAPTPAAPPPAPSSVGAPPPAPAPMPAPAPQPHPGSIAGAPSGFTARGVAPFSGAATPIEQVTFTAYHPREMQAHQWQPLVFYISLDTPAVLAEVEAAAADRLAGKRDKFRAARSEQSAGLARGAKLRLIPSAPELQFNPSHLDVTWQEDVQQHEFRMRAEGAKPGQSVNGFVQIYQGMVLRGEVPISIFVGQAAAHLDSPDAYARAMARAYRRIFASYSHRDTAVVESCETAARTMGDQFLRDVSLLQAGVEWDPRLIQAINDADVFQLFWSKRAAQSQFVAREWQHALKLLPSRPNFIRPVYWSNPLYPTPPELNSLHFQQLSLTNLGWGPIRSALYSLRNR